MRRHSGVTRVVLCGWLVLQSCATYDNPPLGSGAGRSNGGEGGTSGSAGTPSTAGTAQAGDAAEGGAPGTAGALSEGGAGEGGTPSNAGEGGVGAGAEAGAAGASVGEAGAAGGGACESMAPEASCSCVAHDAHDYWFCATFLTFSAAEAKCTAAGMHLPKIDSQAEDDWLFATAALQSTGEYYLGATDAGTPNEWSWLAGGKLWSGVADGTGTGFTNWSANEPNASGDCLVVQSNGPWDDRICMDQRKYVCEAP